MGNHLGLRLQEPDPEVGKIVVNCLSTGDLVEKALLLDGMQLANLSGRAVGTLTVHQVRSVPMDQKDILDAVDKLMWAESEAQRVAPKTQEKIQDRPQENTPVRTVEKRSPPRVPRKTWSPPREPKGGRYNQSPSQPEARDTPQRDRPQTPGRWEGRAGSRARSPNPDVCYPCNRAGRPANHDYFTCTHWIDSQRTGGGRQSVSPPLTPKSAGDKVCLTCQSKRLPSEHFYRKCPLWQKAYEAKHQKAAPPPPGTAKPPTPPKGSPSPKKNTEQNWVTTAKTWPVVTSTKAPQAQ